MNCLLRKIKRSEREKTKIYVMRNGEMFLEKLIKSCNNKRNPLHCYCAEELMSATNNYDKHKVIKTGMSYELYKGFLQDHPVSVMKFFEDFDYAKAYCFNNIVYASQMIHKNVLRLVGCCLETQNPILVFESAEYGTLADRIYHPRQPHFEPLPWTLRLKIAMEIAYAIAYLHVGFSRPTVFRKLEPSNILLDEQNVAKVFDFSFSVSIPEGETHITDWLLGTFGYIAPEYVTNGDCNEKCDVYSFGMLLLELLTGQRAVDRSRRQEIEDEYFLGDHVRLYIERSRFNEIIDAVIVGDGLCSATEQKVQAFTKLAFSCLSVSAEDRPTMVDVARKLRLMHRSER
ncbi:hypothetical protein CICLE_v10005345mg [Citrus x clementina]|uniref:Protein kinase domain-containing protein n=1 Tax=Citrus clementina TaxID=85681 RepID=V4RKD6_CITCL|nr:non-functional pseudokinase ZED1 [Citrus x clementina]ESR34598.1 hypothetical protein CICLE_v10005345mg [Citrus x clementina]